YAAEGTAAHELAERCLRTNTDAIDHFGEVIDGFDVDHEMTEAVQQYLDYVRDQPGIRFIEQRVDFSPWVPEGFGTADTVVIRDGVATVVDLKYGKGVRVNADDNPQAMLYGLGALNDFQFVHDIETFKLVIVQPRLDHISEWEISRDDLVLWAEGIVGPAANLALSDEPEFQPGERQCQFCKAKATCRALAEFNFKTAIADFEDFDEIGETVRPFHLTDEEVAVILPKLDILTNWAKAVEAYALSRLETGHDVPGYKLVEGRSIRKWIDEEAAIRALSRKLGAKNATTKKIITITQAEKQLGKKDPLIAKYTEKPPGKPAVAPLSDKRPALKIDPTEGFDEVA
ncbi:MAG: DUF2800 domain-containing protein, partial [Roseibium sp.]|nr:DUF2800 domain-containing protein [Roseibium sp.]